MPRCETPQPEVLSPEWEDSVRRRHRVHPRNTSFTKSFFGRSYPAAGLIRDYLRSMGQGPNVAIIGVGRDYQEHDHCASGPFELAGTLEGLDKIDYRMAIVDILHVILEEARNRERIWYKSLSPITLDPADQLWNQYLRDTKQRGSRRKGTNGVLKTARVPRLFQKKAETGEVCFVQGDIVTADIGHYGPFDYIQCFEVLVHLYPFDSPQTDGGDDILNQAHESLILAVHNMARNLRKGGILAVDDGHRLEADWDSRTSARIEGLENKMGIKLLETAGWSSKHDYLFYQKQ